MKFGIKIMPREVLLDSQGRAVQATLEGQSYAIQNCRVGKYIELEIPIADAVKAKEEAKRITEFVLYNPLIESYEISLLEKS